MATITVSTWDEMAVDYVRQRATSPAFLTESPVVLRMLGNMREKTALDVGCGGGDYSFRLHEHGAIVLGLDPSVEMIRQATEEQVKRGIIRGLDFKAEGLVGYSLLTGFGPQIAYDRILFAHVLNHMDDLKHAAKIVAEISAGEGVLVVTIPHPLNTAKAYGSNELVIEDYFTARRRQETWVLNGTTYNSLYWHRPLSEYTDFFRDSGYDIIEIVEPRPSPDIKPRNDYDKVNLEKRQRLPSTLAIKGIKRT